MAKSFITFAQAIYIKINFVVKFWEGHIGLLSQCDTSIEIYSRPIWRRPQIVLFSFFIFCFLTAFLSCYLVKHLYMICLWKLTPSIVYGYLGSNVWAENPANKKNYTNVYKTWTEACYRMKLPEVTNDHNHPIWNGYATIHSTRVILIWWWWYSRWRWWCWPFVIFAQTFE